MRTHQITSFKVDAFTKCHHTQAWSFSSNVFKSFVIKIFYAVSTVKYMLEAIIIIIIGVPFADEVL
jgi:hypothetical protein